MVKKGEAEEQEHLLSDREIDEYEHTSMRAHEHGDKHHNKGKLGVTILLLLILLVTVCPESILTPFFPTAAAAKGLTEIQIGLVYGSYELTRFLTAPLIGALIVRIPPYKISIFGATMSAVGSVAFGCLYYISNSTLYFILCLILRMASGIGCTATYVSLTCILLNTSPYKTATVVGLVEILIGLGYALGRPVGAGLYLLGGFTCPFMVNGGLLVILNIIQIFAVPKEEYPDKEKTKDNFKLLRIPGVLVVFSFTTIFHLTQAARYSFFSIYLSTKFHMRPTEIALWFIPSPLIYMIGCPLMSALTNKGFVYSTMLVMMTLTATSYLFLAPPPFLEFIFHDKTCLSLTLTLHVMMSFLWLGAYIPPFQAMIDLAMVNGYEKGSLEMNGMVAGLANAANGLGFLIGPLVGGALIQRYGFNWNLTILSGVQVLTVALTILYLVVMRMTRRPISPEKISDDVEGTESSSLIVNSLKSVKSKFIRRLNELFVKSTNSKRQFSLKTPQPHVESDL